MTDTDGGWLKTIKASLWNRAILPSLWNTKCCISSCHHQRNKHQINWQAPHFGNLVRSKAIPLPKKRFSWEMQALDRCHQAPRLPHNMDVDVTKCHACRTNCALPGAQGSRLLVLRSVGQFVLSCANPDNHNVSTFQVFWGWGGGLGFTSFAKTDNNNVSTFQVFWGWGGGLGFTSFAKTDNNNGSTF